MPNILVFRDLLFVPSEREFLQRQYVGFENLRPNWVGCRSFKHADPSDPRPIMLGSGRATGLLRRLAFRQFGYVSHESGLEELNPVLIHAQFARGGALALPLARHFAIPLVVTFHGGDVYKDRHYTRQLMPTLLQRRWKELIEVVALSVCVSEAVKEKLKERGMPEHKMVVHPIGAPNVLTAYVENTPRHLLFAGRFVEKKGVFVLIEAMRILRQRGESVPLIMAGDGPLLAEVRRRAYDIPGIVLPGWVSQAECQALMKDAYALVIPSITGKDGDHEGFPSVYMEALSMACPAVVSDQASLAEAVDFAKAGIVVPAGNAPALADALLLAVRDATLRRAMSQNALSIAQRHYSASVQSRKLELLMLDIIRGFDHNRKRMQAAAALP